MPWTTRALPTRPLFAPSYSRRAGTASRTRAAAMAEHAPALVRLHADLALQAKPLADAVALGDTRWSRFAASALRQYNDAEDALRRLNPSASAQKREQAMRSLDFQLSTLAAVLRNSQQGAYGGRPSGRFVQRFAIARVAVGLRRQELGQSKAVMPISQGSEPAFLAWFTATLFAGEGSTVASEGGAWLHEVSAITQEVWAAEKRLASPHVSAAQLDEAARHLTCTLTALRQKCSVLPSEFEGTSWQSVVHRLHGYLDLRLSELSILP